MTNGARMNHADMMDSLAKKHEALLDLIGNHSFIYVDIPIYGNIGDLLIMQGTFKFFEKYKLSPRISAPVFAFNTNWIRPNEIVLFQGGGNFGDLYHGMQQLREKVVIEKPNNRIIILPQTIHFSSKEAMDRSVKIFRAHPDVHICVRDTQSYQSAQKFTDNVYLLPDMAHQLYPVLSEQPSTPKGNLLVSRTDGEKLNHNNQSLVFDKVTDWPELIGTREKNFRRFYLAMRLMYRSGFGVIGNKTFTSFWTYYASTLTRDAVELFSGYEHIYTDRLHGHILACLMNKPNTVIDNSYGKNSGYLNAWSGNSEIVTLEKNPC
jgi:pyruvyl transferase EpsO